MSRADDARWPSPARPAAPMRPGPAGGRRRRSRPGRRRSRSWRSWSIPRTQSPKVVLQGKRDHRQLAMVIGAGRGDRHRGAPARRDAAPAADPRSLPHAVRPAQGHADPRGHHRPRDDIYYATLHLTGAAGELTLDSRPSDAIALAIRAKVPVLRRGPRVRQGRPATRAAPRPPSEAHGPARRRRSAVGAAAPAGGRLRQARREVSATSPAAWRRRSSPTRPSTTSAGCARPRPLLRGFAHRADRARARTRQWGIDAAEGRAALRAAGDRQGQARPEPWPTAAEAIFFTLKLLNLTSKFGANTGELLQEILRIAIGEGRAVLFMDEVEALSLDHLLPPPQAREASARLVAALCEKLDAMEPSARVLVVGVHQPDRRARPRAGGPRPARPPRRGGAARRRRPARDPRAHAGPDREARRPPALRAHRLPQAAAPHGRA